MNLDMQQLMSVGAVVLVTVLLIVMLFVRKK